MHLPIPEMIWYQLYLILVLDHGKLTLRLYISIRTVTLSEVIFSASSS